MGKQPTQTFDYKNGVEVTGSTIIIQMTGPKRPDRPALQAAADLISTAVNRTNHRYHKEMSELFQEEQLYKNEVDQVVVNRN